MSRVEKALSLMAEGFSCSQAVFSAYAEESGLDSLTAHKIACGFGGGMARLGQTCGAVSGAYMAIGLKYGKAKAEENGAKEKTYLLVQEFTTRFLARHGSVNCTELLSVSLKKAEGQQAARDRKLFDTVCPQLVRSAAEIFEMLLAENPV